ncbi:hypothetical protein [Nocardia mexicana]|nr:hypothetical protein [Nocardia mexicana]
MWTRPAHEPKPTVVDPEYWRETTDRDGDRLEEDAMSLPAHIGYCLVG